MVGSRRSLLTGLLGVIGFSMLGIRVEKQPAPIVGYVVTHDGWVLRRSDLELFR